MGYDGNRAEHVISMVFFLRCMYEVRYDMKQAGDLGLFLSALGDDQVTGSVPQAATNGDSSFNYGNKSTSTTSGKYPEDEEVPALPALQ